MPVNLALAIETKDDLLYGWEIVRWLHWHIQSRLDPRGKNPPGLIDWPAVRDQGLPRYLNIRTPSDWLRSAGNLAACIAGSEAIKQNVDWPTHVRMYFPGAAPSDNNNNNAQSQNNNNAAHATPGTTATASAPLPAPFSFLFSTHNELRIELKIDKETKKATERMRVFWANGTSGDDLSYEDIVAILGGSYQPATFATRLLDRLRGLPAPNNAFMDFMLGLLVGLEGSRNNASFATSIMMLELMQQGQLTFKDAFDTSHPPCAFPMATTKTGPRNMIERGFQLFNHIDPGESTVYFLENPVHHAVPLNEIRLVIQWIEYQRVQKGFPPFETAPAQDIRNWMRALLTQWFGAYYV